MALAPGTRLGPYAITAPIGAGGIGEVYRAPDTHPDRTVAVNVLPEHVAFDPAPKQRFEPEAKTPVHLQHPHIYPSHEVGSQAPSTGSGQAVDFLVVEYLEGETFERRLKTIALPLGQGLQLGLRIADVVRGKSGRQPARHI